MIDARSYAHFIKWLAGSLAAGVTLSMLFVAVIDPYALYRWVDRPGFNHVKPGLDHHQENIKLALAKAARPDTVILGNSRAEIGFNPGAQAFAGHAAFNLAIPGTGIDTAYRQLRALQGAGIHPATFVVGLEFIDFLHDPMKADTPAAPETWSSRQQWRVDTLFSVDAMFAAVQTLRIQRDEEARIMTANGFNPLAEYRRLVRQDGHHAIFQQRAQENAKNLARKPQGLFVQASGTSADWIAFDALMDAAAPQATQVALVIYPYHAQLMATFEQTGLMPFFEQWKSMLAQRVAELNSKYPNTRISLWDFSGYGTLQCEAVPAKGSKAQARWYWESGHFKSALGDVMLSKLLAAPGVTTAPADFGVQLLPASLDDNRARIATERGACQASAPALFTEIAALVKHSRSSR